MIGVVLSILGLFNFKSCLGIPRETVEPETNKGLDWEKILANQWNRERITEESYAGRGRETKWEIPVNIVESIVLP